MRRGRLLEYIWNTPWLLWTIIALIVIGIGFWIWEQVQENREADALQKKRAREHSDSIWND